jgi:hypothetical protein
MHTLTELEGFVEEINEPEEYWALTYLGDVVNSKYLLSNAPNWMRFKTEESADKFRDALKDTHGAEPKFVKVVAMCDALNNRVTK